MAVSRAKKGLIADWWWSIDRWLLAAFLILMLGGMMLSFAASPPVAERIGLEPFHFVKRHALFLFPSIAVMLATSLLTPHGIRRMSLIMLCVALVTMVLALFFGMEVKGARRWMSFGPFSVQPSEFMKPAFVIVCAWLFAERARRPDVPGNLLSLMLLIVVAALLIVWEAIPAVLSPRLPEAPALGLGINLFAGVINAVWAWVLISSGRRLRSPALEADGHHILSDVVTSVGVLFGLVLAIATGYAVLDPLLAIIVACNILYQGWKVIARSVDGLMDRAVPDDEEEAIKQAIAANAGGSLGVHDLKTRQAGPAIFVDFHMVVPSAMPVREAHDICDRLEDAIRVVHPGARIAIHVEPEGEKAHGIRVKVVEGLNS